MAILKKENVVLRETDEGKIKELEARGFVKVTEADLKPKAKKKGETKE